MSRLQFRAIAERKSARAQLAFVSFPRLSRLSSEQSVVILVDLSPANSLLLASMLQILKSAQQRFISVTLLSTVQNTICRVGSSTHTSRLVDSSIEVTSCAACRTLHSQSRSALLAAPQTPRGIRRAAERAGRPPPVTHQRTHAATGDGQAATSAQSPQAASAAAAATTSTSSAAANPATSMLYTSFAEMGIPSALVSRLSALGISAPSLIQQRVIPFLQRYSHTGVLIHSPTGTGKSLAFLLPVLGKLLEQRAAAERSGNKYDPTVQGIQAVVICPTQELALQTHAQLHALLAAPGSPPPPPLGVGNDSFVALCVGGFHDIETQRDHLRHHTPTIIIGTPRRLNSLFFPLYETHGTWQQKRDNDAAIAAATEAQRDAHSAAQLPRRVRPREVIFNPPEDDEPISETSADGTLDPNDWPSSGLKLDENDWMDEDEKRESHKVPDFIANRAARNAAAKSEWEQRNNVARAAGDLRSAEQRQQEDDEDDMVDPELDGADELFMPPRHAVGWQAQKLLMGDPDLLRAKVASPLKRLIRNVQFLVIDEADEVLKPLNRHPTRKTVC
jgi:hypothetical protein